MTDWDYPVCIANVTSGISYLIDGIVIPHPSGIVVRSVSRGILIQDVMRGIEVESASLAQKGPSYQRADERSESIKEMDAL